LGCHRGKGGNKRARQEATQGKGKGAEKDLRKNGVGEVGKPKVGTGLFCRKRNESRGAGGNPGGESLQNKELCGILSTKKGGGMQEWEEQTAGGEDKHQVGVS